MEECCDKCSHYIDCLLNHAREQEKKGKKEIITKNFNKNIQKIKDSLY